MKAVVWHGRHDVRVENVPDPRLLSPRDAIIQVSSTAICGADLHMYDGHLPSSHRGDILGHEFMGRVVEVGSEVKNLKAGDRVVVPFVIACGRCFYCREGLTALCDNSNPYGGEAEKLFGSSGAALFGHTRFFGGFPGGQAEFVRVPFADFGPLKIDDGLPDDKVLFLSDLLPGAWTAVENCGIRPGDVVAVFGCGPVGQMALRLCRLMGAEKVIALDPMAERLRFAEKWSGAETVNVEDFDRLEIELKRLTGGRGPDACIDAVGMEAHGHSTGAFFDRAKQVMHIESDRPTVLRQAILACRKGGTVSVAGTYAGTDNLPMGAAFAKGLTLRMGYSHVHRSIRALLERIENGEIDPSFLITHRLPLHQAPEGYRLFRNKEEECLKVVLQAGN